jgi:hypothetical protein
MQVELIKRKSKSKFTNINIYLFLSFLRWWVEKLEISFKGSGLKYQFYDGSYNKPASLEKNEINSEIEYIKK